MTTVSSKELNERACFLLSQGSVSEGLELFKKALTVRKTEIKDRPTNLRLSDTAQKPLSQEPDTTAGMTGEHSCGFLPAHITCTTEHERFWIYSHPLSMQRVPQSLACAMLNENLDVFTLFFNVALASHLQGVEEERGGRYDAAHHSFSVAMKMYNLTLCQFHGSYSINGAILNTLNGHAYAAILGNLAHVHAMLGEMSQSVRFADHLLTTLFYLMDSGRVTTAREVLTHKLLLENTHCLLMASSNSAAAA
jgi:hypothetical protein